MNSQLSEKELVRIVIACQYELKFPSLGYTVWVHLEVDSDEHRRQPGLWSAEGGCDGKGATRVTWYGDTEGRIRVKKA